jgi:hypothetical protein
VESEQILNQNKQDSFTLKSADIFTKIQVNPASLPCGSPKGAGCALGGQ